MIVRSYSPQEQRALDYIRSEVPRAETHLVATRDFALEINEDQSLGLNEEKVVLAALCHDLARLMDPAEIESQLRQRGIDPDSLGFVTPILSHGHLSAELARERIGIEDEEVLEAIRWHATGRGEMSLLEKLVYVADKVEATRDYPGVEKLRELVREDFHRSIPLVIGSVIKHVVAMNQPLDYNSVAAYNRALGDARSRLAWRNQLGTSG